MRNSATTDSNKTLQEEKLQSKPKGQPQLNLSDACISKLKEICKDQSFLRVTVEGGGCSGFQYKFELDNVVHQDDIEFGAMEARVVIDNTSLIYCAGATVDYHNELIRSGFRIIGNPQAEQGCSCGSSFAIKMD